MDSKIFLPPINYKEIYGEGYVIITGGTGAIGLSFAKEFIKQKYKILLVSSNLERLKKAKEDLIKEFPLAEIIFTDIDLASPFTEERVKEIDNKINDIIKGEEIAILINNAGLGKGGNFLKMPYQIVINEITINALAPVILSKIIIEKMIKRSKKSLIVFSGS